MTNEVTTTVFTKNACPNCDATKSHLDSLGVAYNVINISEQPEYLDKLVALGFRGAPVVVTPQGAWAGYKKDKIEEVFGS